MEKQPKIPGGFDSHETSEEMSGTGDSPLEFAAFKENNSKAMEMMKEMADGYDKKLRDMSETITKLYSKVKESEDEEELDTLRADIDILQREWDQIHALMKLVENHAYGEKNRADLN